VAKAAVALIVASKATGSAGVAIVGAGTVDVVTVTLSVPAVGHITTVVGGGAGVDGAGVDGAGVDGAGVDGVVTGTVVGVMVAVTG
jgi:hypothetical protein